MKIELEKSNQICAEMTQRVQKKTEEIERIRIENVSEFIYCLASPHVYISIIKYIKTTEKFVLLFPMDYFILENYTRAEKLSRSHGKPEVYNRKQQEKEICYPMQ